MAKPTKQQPDPWDTVACANLDDDQLLYLPAETASKFAAVFGLPMVHPIELLALAHDLVNIAHKRFDTSESKCGECGLRHFDNYNHAKAAERTRGLLQKIENLIRTNPWDRNTDPREPSNEAARSEHNDTKRT